MGVSTTVSVSGPYTANGTNRLWDFNYKTILLSHLQLLVTDNSGVVTTITTGFTATGIGASNGGTVTYPVAPADPLPAGYKVVVQRLVPFTQDTILGNQGAYFPQIHETRFDLMTMEIQQVADKAKNTLFVPLSEGLGNFQLPNVATRANRVLGFDILGNPVAAMDITAAMAAGNIPVPLLSDVAKFLKATAVGTYSWQPEAGGFGTRTTVASAATVNLSAIPGHFANITGTTDITSFGTLPTSDNPIYILKFTGILNIVGGPNLFTPGAATLKVFPGDYVILENATGGTQWVVLSYLPAIAGTGFGTRGSVVAAGTVDIGASGTHFTLVTGIATITSFGSNGNFVAPVHLVQFSSNATLVHSANLVLPSGVNMTVSTGDTILVHYEAAGAWRVLGYWSLTTGPSVQRFLTGTGTYTPAPGTKWVRVRMVGGGGGGGAQNTNAGAAGTTTFCFGWSANAGGAGGAGIGGFGAGGTGGTNGTGTLVHRIDGEDGGQSANFNPTIGCSGGGSAFFGGAGQARDRVVGSAGKVNSGGGGAAGGNPVNGWGGGGGGGESVEFIQMNPVAAAYQIGAGGNGGAAGTIAGANGGSGVLIIEEFFK